MSSRQLAGGGAQKKEAAKKKKKCRLGFWECFCLFSSQQSFMHSRVVDLYICRRVKRSPQCLFVCVWKPGCELCSENLGITRDLTAANPALHCRRGDTVGGVSHAATSRWLEESFSELRRFPNTSVGAGSGATSGKLASGI